VFYLCVYMGVAFIRGGGGFDWSFARLAAPVVTTNSTILSSNNFHNENFRYRRSRVVLGNGL